MSHSFADDVAVITGAGSGIGEACARALLDAGALVVGIDIDGARLKPIAERYGERFLSVVLDLRDGAAVHARLADLPAQFAKPTILINSAGLSYGAISAVKMPYENWETTVDVNIKGLMAVTHAILPGMVERNRGHVVNLGSTAGTYAVPTSNVYGSTKAFVKMFSANLRADLVGTRVRVTEIAPGAVLTNIGLARAGGDVEKMRAYYAKMPCLDVEDISKATLWVLGQPERVQVNVLEITPLGMAPGPMLRQKPA